jgi:hypothetical protein
VENAIGYTGLSRQRLDTSDDEDAMHTEWSMAVDRRPRNPAAANAGWRKGRHLLARAFRRVVEAMEESLLQIIRAL